MTDKNLNIRVGIDAKNFDRQIQDLQRRLNQMQQTNQTMGQIQNQYGAGSRMGNAASGAFAAFNDQSIRELREKHNLNTTIMERQHRLVERKKKQLEEISKLEGSSGKEDKERLSRLKEEITLLERRTRIRAQENVMVSRAATQMGGSPSDFGMQGSYGPSGMNMGAMGRYRGFRGMGLGQGTSRFLTSFGGPIMAGAGMLAAGLPAFNSIRDEIAEKQRNEAMLGGSALRGSSREMREFASGRGSDAIFYGRERAEAAGILSKEYSNRRSRDVSKGLSNGIVGRTLGGVAAGAAAGAGIGAIFGGAPAIPGAIIGGGLGLLSPLVTDKQTRGAVWNSDEYKKSLMAEAMGRRPGLEEALKAKDPGREIGRQGFMQNVDRNLQLTRMLGGSSIYGNQGDPQSGFLYNQMTGAQKYGNLPVSEQQVIASANQITGAGGTTAAANRMSGTAAAFNRQFNINNAGSLMGTLSSAGMSPEKTEETTKRIFAEAVKIGVDASRMPQEMQRFANAAIKAATSGGGFSEEAIRRVGESTTGTSSVEIAAGLSAQQAYESRGREGSGYRGQLGFGFLNSGKLDSIVGKEAASKIRKDSKLMNRLNQLSPEELQKSPELLAGISSRLGISQEETLGMVRKLNAEKQTYMRPTESLLKEYGELASKYSSEEMKGMEGASALYSKIEDQLASEEGESFTKLGSAQRRARIKSMSTGISGQGAGSENQRYLDRMGSKFGEDLSPMVDIDATLNTQKGGAEELESANRTQGQLATIEQINKNIDSMKVTVDRQQALAELAANLFDKFAKSLAENKDAAANLDELAEALARFVEKSRSNGITSGEPAGG